MSAVRVPAVDLVLAELLPRSDENASFLSGSVSVIVIASSWYPKGEQRGLPLAFEAVSEVGSGYGRFERVA